MAMTANLYYPETKRWRVSLALVLILAAHLALFWFFGLTRAPHTQSVHDDHALVVWMVPSPPSPKPQAKPLRLPTAPVPAVTRPATAPKVTSMRLIAKSSLPTPAAPPDPGKDSHAATTTAPTTPGLANVDLTKIWGEIDKDAPPNHLAQKYSAEDTKLVRGIKGAWRGGGTTTTTITLPDGRVLTKVVGPGGTYCASKDSVGAPGGRDQIKDGVRDHMRLSVTGDCPH